MRKFTLFFMSLFLTVGAMAVDDPAVMDVNTSTVYTIQFNNGGSFVYCDNGEIYYEGTHNAANAENANYQFKFIEAATDAQGRKLYYIASVGADGFYAYNENTTNPEEEGGAAGSVGLTNDATTKTEKGVWYVFSDGNFQYIVPAWKEGDSYTRGGCCWNKWSSSNNNLGMWGRGTNNPNYAGDNQLIITDINAEVEDPIESAMTFNWTTSTPWTDAEGDLSSTVLNDNAMAYGIKYIETEITVGGPRTATVTFRYTSGNCALNIRGVEVINQYGLAVAGDYHVGKAGGSHEKNVYTVKVAEAGTYTVRLYATFGANDRADATNGNITVAFAAADAASFSHDVTFTAEYATLYLGYQVAIPEGVEAYVVESASDGYAHLVEIENAIPATTAVILKNIGGKTDYKFDYSSENITEFTDNLLVGSITNCYVQEEAYVLAKNGEEVCFGLASMNQLNKGAFLNNANKAYLPAGEVSAAAYYSFRFGEGTTGVEEVKTENGEVKVIYDLTGRRVEAITAPGIYIVNGKKVLVK